MQQYRYFTEEEFNKVGCSLSQMDSDFMKKLDVARHFAGVPFVITSAFRTPEVNKRVGGSPNSAHLSGRAVDIACVGSLERAAILSAFLSGRCLGLSIGIYPRHIHVGWNDLSVASPRVFIGTYSNSK